MIHIKGLNFNSFHAACQYFRVDSSYLSKKSKVTGTAKEELLKEKLQSEIRKYPFVYNDKQYANLSMACQEFNLDPVKVQSLIDNRVISKEAALDLSIKYKGNVPRNRKGIPVTINGIKFASKSAAIRHFGVAYDKFYELQRNGLNPEQAINLLKKAKQ